jgi:hypothetical protein
VNAGPDGCIVSVGSGATGAIDKLQQIIGVPRPPPGKPRRCSRCWEERFSVTCSSVSRWCSRALRAPLQRVTAPGTRDRRRGEPRRGRRRGPRANAAEGPVPRTVRIGAFSAASSEPACVPVHEIARILRTTPRLLRFAASAPTSGRHEPAGAGRRPVARRVFLSPHKFLGGPGRAASSCSTAPLPA